VYRRRYESRRSSKPKLHFIKKNKIKYGKKRFSISRIEFLHPAMWYVVLWDDMPLNSPQRPPYWNSTSGFDFDHITAVEISFCTSLWNFIQIGPPSAEKNDVMSIFKMAEVSHLGFYGPIMGYLIIIIRRLITRAMSEYMTESEAPMYDFL